MDDITKNQNDIDPKDLMAVERATTGLIGTAISFIILGFIVEKFELFLKIISVEMSKEGRTHVLPHLTHIVFYKYLGISIIIGGILLAVFTYRYYLNWIDHLQRKEIDTDKNIYYYISLFVVVVGILLVGSMVVL